MDSAQSTGRETAGQSPGQASGRASGKDERLMMAEADAAELERWWPRRILIGAALWLVGAALLIILALYFAAHRTATLPGDRGLLALVQHISQPLLVRFINLSSDANWPRNAGITVFAVTLALALARRFRAAICALLSGFLADFTSFFLLNDTVKRIRPRDISLHTFQGIGAWSYPSGHVVHVTAFYGFLLYLALHEQRFHPNWTPWLRVVQVICGYFLVFIGISRLLEDDHWPSDVLAAYLLGAMMLALTIVLYHALALLWLRRDDLLAWLRSARGVSRATSG